MGDESGIELIRLSTSLQSHQKTQKIHSPAGDVAQHKLLAGSCRPLRVIFIIGRCGLLTDELSIEALKENFRKKNVKYFLIKKYYYLAKYKKQGCRKLI